jgi:hypothetical protein
MSVKDLKVLVRARAIKSRSSATSKVRLIELLRNSDAQSDRVSAAVAVGESEPVECGNGADDTFRWSADSGARLIHLITVCNLSMCEDLKISLRKYSVDKETRFTKERLLELYARSEKKKSRTQMENKLGDYELYWNCVHEMFNNPMFKPVHFDRKDPNLQDKHGSPLFDPARHTGQQPLKKLQHYYAEYRSAYAKSKAKFEKSGHMNPNFADFVMGRTLIYYLHLGFQGSNGDITKGVFSSGMPCNLADVQLVLGDDSATKKSSSEKSSSDRAKRKLKDMTVADLMHVFQQQAPARSVKDNASEKSNVVSDDLARSVLEERLFMLYDRLDSTSHTRKKARKYLEAQVSEIEEKLGMSEASDEDSCNSSVISGLSITSINRRRKAASKAPASSI